MLILVVISYPKTAVYKPRDDVVCVHCKENFLIASNVSFFSLNFLAALFLVQVNAHSHDELSEQYTYNVQLDNEGRYTMFYVLLKALPPVCMKYTARDESRVANIARGEDECYICHKTLIKSCMLSYKRSGSVLLYFTLTKVSAKFSSLVILTHSLNK